MIMKTCSYISVHSGCEPLTPDDIAEIIVFAASRRENVVVAETMIYPSHQVCGPPLDLRQPGYIQKSWLRHHGSLIAI